MSETFVEYFGILASFVILVALLMSSVKRLRIINLFGAILMIIYGYLINALPIIIMNTGIAFINIYYLRKMYKVKDSFEIISIDQTSDYVKSFISYYQNSLTDKLGFDEHDLQNSEYRYFIVRNMVPAGLFVAKEHTSDTLEIAVDFVTPDFRDYKTGMYVYTQMSEKFQNQGYKKFITYTDDINHIKYLEKMNFKPTTINNKTAYVKEI